MKKVFLGFLLFFCCAAITQIAIIQIGEGYPLPYARVQGKKENRKARKDLGVIVFVRDQDEEKIKRALRSVITQQNKTHFIVVKDYSGSEETFDMIATFFSENKPKVSYYIEQKNPSFTRAEAIRESLERINPQVVVLYLDADNYLAHETVLSDVNKIYQDERVWVTVGTAYVYPSFSAKRFRRLPFSYLFGNQVLRSAPCEYSPFMTCYAGMIKKVFLSDWDYEMCDATAKMDPLWIVPVLEMARNHIYYMNEIAFIQHSNMIIQANETLLEFLQSKRPYDKLRKHPNPMVN